LTTPLEPQKRFPTTTAAQYAVTFPTLWVAFGAPDPTPASADTESMSPVIWRYEVNPSGASEEGRPPPLSVMDGRETAARMHPSFVVEGIDVHVVPPADVLRSIVVTTDEPCAPSDARVVLPRAPRFTCACIVDDVPDADPPHGRRSFSFVYPVMFGQFRGEGVEGFVQLPVVHADVVALVEPTSEAVFATVTVCPPIA